MGFKNGWHRCIEFIEDKWRYFLAGIVFILIILLLAFVVSKKTTTNIALISTQPIVAITAIFISCSKITNRTKGNMKAYNAGSLQLQYKNA